MSCIQTQLLPPPASDLGLHIRTGYLDYRLTCFCLYQAPPRPGSWRRRDLLQVSVEGLEDPPAAASASIGIPGTGHRDGRPQQRRVDGHLQKGDTWNLSILVRVQPGCSPAELWCIPAQHSWAWLCLTAYFLLTVWAPPPQKWFLNKNGSLIYPTFLFINIIIKILFSFE